MMLRNRTARRSIERLEDRSMLAGNVAAAVDISGNLTLDGDLASNKISVEQVSATEWQVQGHDTTVNGSMDAFLATGVTGSIIANLGAGHDSMRLSGDVALDLTINTDVGNDRVSVYDATIAGNLGIDTGDGHDLVFLRNVDVAGAVGVTVNTGGGHDNLYVDTLTALNGNFDTGDGNDVFQLKRASFSADLNISTGDGFDHVMLNRVGVDGALVVDLGPGDFDQLVAINTDVAGSATLDGGDGEHDRLVRVAFSAGSETTAGFEVEHLVDNLMSSLAERLEGIGHGHALGRLV